MATSKEAAIRFQVDDHGFKRHLVLADSGGKTLADFYLGTSPGFRKINARRADNDAISTVEFNAYDDEPSATVWFDRHLAGLDKKVITAVKRGREGLHPDKDG